MNLDRDILLCVCKDGHISFRLKGNINPEFPHALPFHSVDSMEEAKAIRVTHCRKMYDDTWVLTHWAGDVDDIFTLADSLGLQ